MKKLLIILVVFTIYVFAGCADSGSDYPRGYRNIFPATSSMPSNAKRFTLSNIGVSCGPAESCNAIINMSESKGVNFVGIAASNTSTPFNLKIYCPASSIPVGTTPLTNCSIELRTGSSPKVYETAANQTINVTITKGPVVLNQPTYYTIVFNDNFITVEGHQILKFDTITAQLY